MTADSQEKIEARVKAHATHNPWDRWSEEERETHLRQGGSRPIQWTLDPFLNNTLTETGRIYVYCGGPVEGAPNAAPKKRADGEVDGRSKGVRKCGRCGGHGHNARTCRGTPLAAQEPAQPTVSTPSGPAPAPRQTTPVAPVTAAVESRPAVRENAPAPRVPEMRAAIHVPGRKTCGKCGEVGHNARTCGKGGSPMVAIRVPGAGPTGRLNTCGRCGGKGHNARTCKG